MNRIKLTFLLLKHQWLEHKLRKEQKYYYKLRYYSCCGLDKQPIETLTTNHWWAQPFAQKSSFIMKTTFKEDLNDVYWSGYYSGYDLGIAEGDKWCFESRELDMRPIQKIGGEYPKCRKEGKVMNWNLIAVIAIVCVTIMVCKVFGK